MYGMTITLYLSLNCSSARRRVELTVHSNAGADDLRPMSSARCARWGQQQVKAPEIGPRNNFKQKARALDPSVGQVSC